MAVFNYPVSDSNRKGLILTQVGADGTINVVSFPPNTSVTVNTLRTAPDPTTVFSAIDLDGAETASNAALESMFNS